MTTLTTHIVLPEPIERFTRAFVGRHRRLSLLRTACGVTAFCVSWSVAWALADRFFQLPASIRAAVLAINAAVLLIGAGVALRRFRRPGIVWPEAAAAIERRDPALADRLQTVVTQAVMPAGVRGSDALIASLAGEVTGHLSGRASRTLLPARSAIPAVAVVTLVVAAFLALAGSEYLGLPRLLARQFRPFASLPPVTTTRLAVDPGDIDVAQGSAVTLTATAARLGDDVVTLWTGDAPDNLGPQTMPRRDDGKFVVPLKGIEQDTYYRVSGGDAVTPVFAVRVLRKPALRELRVRYAYPAYLARPPLQQINTDGRVEAPRGTWAEIAIVATEPIKAADVFVDRERTATYPTTDPYVRTAWIELKKTQPWSIEMVSDRNVIGGGFDDMRLTAIEDRPPIVQLMREDVRLHPSDVLALPYQALDDYGIESLSLKVSGGGKDLYAAPVPIRSDKRMVRDVITLDLAPYALGFGDVVTVMLTAVDGAGQERTSTPCRVLIAPRSVEPKALQRVAALREAYELSRDLTAAPDGAAPLLKALLRVISQTDSPSAADHTARQIDAAQRLASERAWVFNDRPLEGAQRDIAERLKNDLAQFWKGEQARVVLAELENIEAAEQRQNDASRPEAEALKLSVKRARAEWAAAVKELGLDPSAGDVQGRLEGLTRDLDGRFNDRTELDVVGVVREWGGRPAADSHTARDRVAVAAQAEVLRPDGELSWARDLQLAARAMTHLDDEVAATPGAEDPRRKVDQAVARLNDAHRDTANPDLPAGRRTELSGAADAAREDLRRWAGERAAETAPAVADAMTPPAIPAGASARSPAQQPTADPDAPEVWKPKAVPNRDQAARKSADTARRLAEVTRRQQKLIERTRSFNAQEQAGQLSGEQQSVADAIGQVRQEDEEGFFEPTAKARQETLEAIRSQQQTLAELPQRIAEMRQQAENVRELQKRSQQAHAAAAAAGPADKSAADRAAAEAQRQLDEAQQGMLESTSPAFALAVNALSAAAGNATAGKPPADKADQPAPVVPGRARSNSEGSAPVRSASAEPLPAGFAPAGSATAAPVPLGPTFDDRLAPALKKFQQTLTSGDPAAAQASAGKALDAIAELQASLRVAQRRVVQRDPLVAARFYAEQAQRALDQRPPDLVKAGEYQRETNQALSNAWDSALNRGLRQRLDALPGFRSLLSEDFSGGEADVTADQQAGLAGKRAWGRLSDQSSADVSAAVRSAEPAGFEDALKVYFKALDKARSTREKP